MSVFKDLREELVEKRWSSVFAPVFRIATSGNQYANDCADDSFWVFGFISFSCNSVLNCSTSLPWLIRIA